MDTNNTRGIGFALIPNEGLTTKLDNANKKDVAFDNFAVRFLATGGLIPVIKWHALIPAEILESLQLAFLFSGLIPSSLVWIQKDGHAGGEVRVGLFNYIMKHISQSLMDYAPDLYLTVATEINYITEQGMNCKNYLPGASYIVGKISCEPLFVEDGENILEGLRRIISKACGDDICKSSVREENPEVSDICYGIHLNIKKIQCFSGLIGCASECSSRCDCGANSGVDDLPEDQTISTDCIGEQLADINNSPSEKETREQKDKDPFEVFFPEEEDMSPAYPESSHTADDDPFDAYAPDDDPFGEYDPDEEPVFAESGEIIKDEEAVVANKAKDHIGKQSEIEKRRQLDIVLEMVMRKPSALGKVENQTEDLCLAAVERDGRALRHVHKSKRTYKVCFAAVKNHGSALAYVPVEKRTDEICRTAVMTYGCVLAYVPIEKRTDEICAIAVKNNGLSLQYVPENKRTNLIYLDAVTNRGVALQFVPTSKRSVEICAAAVKNYGLALRLVPEKLRTTEICLEAVRSNGRALKYISKDKLTNEMYLSAVEKEGWILNLVPKDKRSIQVCAAAVKQDVNALEFVPVAMRTPEICSIVANVPEKILSQKIKRILRIQKKLHEQQEKI